MNQFPCLIRTSTAGGEARYALGDPLVDSYLAFVAGRSRPNTLRAVVHDSRRSCRSSTRIPSTSSALTSSTSSPTSGASHGGPYLRRRVGVVGTHDRPGGSRRSPGSTRKGHRWLLLREPGKEHVEDRAGGAPAGGPLRPTPRHGTRSRPGRSVKRVGTDLSPRSCDRTPRRFRLVRNLCTRSRRRLRRRDEARLARRLRRRRPGLYPFHP